MSNQDEDSQLKWRLNGGCQHIIGRKDGCRNIHCFDFLLLMLCCKHFLFYVQHTPKVHVCVRILKI